MSFSSVDRSLVGAYANTASASSGTASLASRLSSVVSMLALSMLDATPVGRSLSPWPVSVYTTGSSSVVSATSALVTADSPPNS